uniref:Armadillo like helical domain containing 3 n=1 Tax=Astyanax mexicanus TaxID=7994 RepID=A0A8B9HG77_ASTMX
MYDEIFTKDDPAKTNPRFWDELFLMKVNLEYLEAKLESLDGDEVMLIKENLNSLFHHCVQALEEEHQIKVVNALQTLCALFRGVHQKNKSATGFDIINMLVGFDKAELRMKVMVVMPFSLYYILVKLLRHFFFKFLYLYLFLCDYDVFFIISLQKTLHYNKTNIWCTLLLGDMGKIIYCCQSYLVFFSVTVMHNPELPLDPSMQTSNLLITFLKYSSIVMQDTKDEHRLNSARLCLIILACIAEDQYADAFLHDDNMNFRVNLHRMVSRHHIVALLFFHFVYLIIYTIPGCKHAYLFVCLFVLRRCVQIIHKLICYQKKCRIRLQYTWRELWSALINLLKFLLSNETTLLAKHNIFLLALQVVNLFNMFITYGDTFLPTPSSYDELYYEIVRMHQVFENLYCMVLRVSTNVGQWKEPASKVTHALVNVRAIINHFNPKIESYAAVNHISQLSEDQVLEVVRSNYDTLTLKLQDGLDQFERYSEQPRETAFFKELVRSISVNVRKNVSLNTLSQDVLLKEFSSIS